MFIFTFVYYHITIDCCNPTWHLVSFSKIVSDESALKVSNFQKQSTYQTHKPFAACCIFQCMHYSKVTKDLWMYCLIALLESQKICECFGIELYNRASVPTLRNIIMLWHYDVICVYIVIFTIPFIPYSLTPWKFHIICRLS